MPNLTTKPSIPKPPSSPPRPKVKLSPWQPPADVDPIPVDPGDKVPT